MDPTTQIDTRGVVEGNADPTKVDKERLNAGIHQKPWKLGVVIKVEIHLTVIYNFSSMPTMPPSDCTFRALFDGRNHSSLTVGTFIDALKANNAKQERGWLRQLCTRDVTIAFVYLRAILASRYVHDEELCDVLQTSWGSTEIPFLPDILFPEDLEPRPVPVILEEIASDPILFMENRLGDRRKGSAWLRSEIFPKPDKFMNETEKRMLRLQVCLLVGMEKSPHTIQRAWGLSKSTFRSIVADLYGIFESPILGKVDLGNEMTPVEKVKRYRPKTPAGFMTRLFTSSVSKDINDSAKRDLECDTEIAIEGKTPSVSPSPQDEAAFFIEEDFDALNEKVIAIDAKTPQNILRKTMASVLSPLRSTRKMQQEINVTESSKHETSNLESSWECLQIAAPNDAVACLTEAATSMATERADDGESIEIALDGQDPDATIVPSADPSIKVIRIDLDRMLSPAAKDLDATSYQENIRSQLEVFRRSVENGDPHLYSFEFEVSSGKHVARFFQVVQSNDFAAFEENAELYGWLEEIVKSSVGTNDNNEGVKYFLAFLGQRYPDALAAAVEDMGYIRVTGPEL